MNYKHIIFKKDKEGDLYVITNDDGSAFRTNLNENEIVIGQLFSDSCPINRSCIDYIETKKVSRFCGHFINLMQLTAHAFSPEGLFCRKSKKYHPVSVLRPHNCPLSGDSCLGCDRLANIKAVPYPEKSNCHVVCNMAG
ncbi:MAG: hypothetical protein AB1427_16900 [Thermodesulfobacteriota bacterium]